MSTGEEKEEEEQRPLPTGEEDDDDPPFLSSRALEALREFLTEQSSAAGADGEEEEGAGGEVKLVAENWNMSQFWYDRDTAQTVAREVVHLLSEKSSSAAVACVACPTLFAYLKKNDPNVAAQLLEYDTRFKQYGNDYTFYDYNQPEELPPELKHRFQVVVADPPYLSKECLEKVARTIAFLAQPEGAYLLLLTGEVQTERAAELLNLQPCGFRPQHSNKLGNEFRLFTSYNPAERLGGWERH
ncbi:protein-lysine N-methyltransferase N6AMT2 [Iris pallida]|uniref:Protein-lysine N-methyltransferase M6B38_116650 n=1 Tax=Iris pallida TaxID=29817 RepID=A0AAX6I4C0_IRIPA|nr:protein-lysine N-methyltransferase N6AMT2 [Iris pallida]